MRAITCDRCGKRIKKTEGIAHINIWYEDLADMNRKETIGEFHGWDFCMDCAEEIGRCIKIPMTSTTPEEGGEIADELEEELDAEPVIESEDEPISEPINEPERWPIDEPPENPKIKWVAVRNALADQWDEQERKAEEAGPDATNHGHIRKKADWPKFKACVDAGRDDKWLAVEFGVTTRTIWTWRKKLAAMEETK